jgi:4-hydroxybenzoate polyprenyltransferase
LRDYARLARPGQWIKNGFVLVGVLFGHAWADRAAVQGALTLFAAFCLVSSAVYAFNDVMDRHADRVHPHKHRRPVASGRIPAPRALAFAVLLVVTGLGLAASVSASALAIAASYIALNVAYSLGVKHVALLDVFFIATGFMLRLLAGTLGLGIEPSRWLLLCGLMVTLFLGFAKRRAELAALEQKGVAGQASGAQEPLGAPVQRRALAMYTLDWLDRMIGVSAAGACIAYALYTIDERTAAVQGTDKLVYTVPFVLYGIYRYLWLLYRRGVGADPSTQLLKDPPLVIAVVAWLGVTLFLIN